MNMANSDMHTYIHYLNNNVMVTQLTISTRKITLCLPHSKSELKTDKSTRWHLLNDKTDALSFLLCLWAAIKESQCLSFRMWWLSQHYRFERLLCVYSHVCGGWDTCRSCSRLYRPSCCQPINVIIPRHERSISREAKEHARLFTPKASQFLSMFIAKGVLEQGISTA